MSQPPYDPQRQPYQPQPPQFVPVPMRTGPSAGKVIIWLLVIFFVIIPILCLVGFVVIMQLGS